MVINKKLTDTAQGYFLPRASRTGNALLCHTASSTQVRGRVRGVLRDEWWRDGGTTVVPFLVTRTNIRNHSMKFRSHELQNAIACANRVFEPLEQPSESPERAGAVSPETLTGLWEFSHVDFSYERPTAY